MPFQQLEHQPARRPGVTLGLNEHVEDLAFGIDGAPEIHPPATDRHDHFVEVPGRVRPAAPAAQISGDQRAEVVDPPPDGFVGDDDAPLGQQILHIPEAQREA